MICIVLDLEWRSVFTFETNLLTNKDEFLWKFNIYCSFISNSSKNKYLKVIKKNLFDM